MDRVHSQLTKSERKHNAAKKQAASLWQLQSSFDEIESGYTLLEGMLSDAVHRKGAAVIESASVLSKLCEPDLSEAETQLLSECDEMIIHCRRLTDASI